MARFSKRRFSGGFRLSDIMRLMSAIGMLCVLAMLMTRARDASMWRWVTQDSYPSDGPPAEVAPQPQEPAPNVAKSEKTDVTEATTKAEAPTEPKVARADVSHLNPEEWKQAEYEFQLVEDKTQLDGLEMQAYWRLLKWVQSQSPDQLESRATREASFTDFVERPSKMRGKLVRLKLHMLRSKRYEAGENRYGFKWLHEVWGYTNDSKPYPYVMVFADWPKGMPLGNNLAEEATVDAYFLKLMKYEAHDGKIRWAPLLLGRLEWHPNPINQSHVGMDEVWFGVCAVGGVAFILLGIKVYRLIFGAPKVAFPLAGPVNTSGAEAWLENMEADQSPAFGEEALAVSSSETNHDSGQ